VARRWQYPSYIEPVLDEAQRPETVLPDKYWQQPSEPLRTAPRSEAALYASGVLVEFGIPVPPIPAISWLILAPEPLRRPPIIPGPPPELALDELQRPEAVSLDKWFVQAPRPREITPPQQPPATELVLDEAQRPEAVSLDKWWSQAANPLCPVSFPQPSLPLLPPFIEEIELDKWWRQPSEPRWQPPAPWLEPATELVLDELQRPEAVSLDKWWIQSLLPLYPKPFAGAGLTIQPPFIEEITLDKWWREPDNPLPAPPSPFYYPWVSYHVLGPEVVTLDKWWVEHYNPVLPLPRIQGFFFLALLEVVAPPYVIVPFAFDDCLFLWEIIHPSSWESAATPSGYKAPAPYVPPPSGYVRKADGTALWDSW